jgi:hypothetical protein
MIWKSVRHILFTELATWVLFLLMAAVMGSLGLRFGSERVSAVLIVVWFGLFLAVYRIRYKRL